MKVGDRVITPAGIPGIITTVVGLTAEVLLDTNGYGYFFIDELSPDSRAHKASEELESLPPSAPWTSYIFSQDPPMIIGQRNDKPSPFKEAAERKVRCIHGEGGQFIDIYHYTGACSENAPDTADDGPEVAVMHAYHLGFIDDNAAEFILEELNDERKD